MSGRKYVTLTDAEARRLRTEAARASTLASANASLNRLNERLTTSLIATQRNVDNLTTSLRNMNTTMQANQRAATAQVTALRNQLQAIVEEYNNRLIDLNDQHQADLRDMQEGMDNAIRQTRVNWANAMDENNRRVEAAIKRIDETQQQIAAVNNRVQNLATAYGKRV